MATQQLGDSGEHLGGKNVLVGTTPTPLHSEHCLVPREHPTSAYSRPVRSGDVEGELLQSVVGGELSIEPVGSKNVAENGLPMRHSTRLTVKGK